MKKTSVLALVLLALSFKSAAAAEQMVGFHLFSHHSPGRDYNNINPGAYIVQPASCGDGIVLGGYLNSYKRFTVYGGCYFSLYRTSVFSVDFFGGLATGYRHEETPVNIGGVALLGMPSFRLNINSSTGLRFTYVPRIEKRGASLLHLSVEYSF